MGEGPVEVDADFCILRKKADEFDDGVARLGVDND
jgi:hypothetical protein